MRILFAGDLHGDLGHLNYLTMVAQENNCSVIFQVGDCGLVWRSDDPMRKAEAVLDRAGLDLYWIDGNHEDFDRLERVYGVTSDAPEPIQMTSHIRYFPRGYVWEVAGKRILTMGGASSIDKPSRTIGISWWPQEEITEAQVERASRVGKVDYMVAHDVPFGMSDFESWLDSTAHYWAPVPLLTSKHHRESVATVVAATEPEVLISGHYHLRYTGAYGFATATGTYNSTVVQVLNRNGTRDESWTILDLPDE